MQEQVPLHSLKLTIWIWSKKAKGFSFWALNLHLIGRQVQPLLDLNVKYSEHIAGMRNK